MARFDGTNNSETINGGSGKDYLYGYAGNDYLYGNDGWDELNGGDGNDRLFGGTGTDTLYGVYGNDYLKGYGGSTGEKDILYGGYGDDTFVLGDSSGVFYQDIGGYAIIADWNPGNDYIQIRGNVNQYSLMLGEWSGYSSYKDVGIFYGNELIGVVQDTNNLNNVRFDRDFLFV